MRLIAKYARDKNVQYISHLDMLRTFQRILRRADFPVEYSSGFNEHMNIAFATATSVGITSASEYIDISLSAEVEPLEAVKSINQHVCDGIKILDAQLVDDAYPSLMGRVAMSDYIISSDNAGLADAFKSFSALDKIIVPKRTKSGVKDTDIRPMIISQAFDGALNVRLAAGSSANLNPVLYFDALMKSAGVESYRNPAIHRTSILDNNGSDMFSLIRTEKQG